MGLLLLLLLGVGFGGRWDCWRGLGFWGIHGGVVNVVNWVFCEWDFFKVVWRFLGMEERCQRGDVR